MSNQAAQESLLTAEQVAQMLNVQRSTVYEWARMEYIPHIHLGVGRKKPLVRFSRAAVEQWLERKSKQGRTTRVPAISLDN